MATFCVDFKSSKQKFKPSRINACHFIACPFRFYYRNCHNHHKHHKYITVVKWLHSPLSSSSSLAGWLVAQFRLGGAALGWALTHLWLSTRGWMAPADMASLWMKDRWYGFLFEWRVSCCWLLCQDILMLASKAIVPWLAGRCPTYMLPWMKG